VSRIIPQTVSPVASEFETKYALMVVMIAVSLMKYFDPQKLGIVIPLLPE
jgi:hypothetical protein